MADQAKTIATAPDLDRFIDALACSQVNDETILAAWDWLRGEFERCAALRGFSQPVINRALSSFCSMFASDFNNLIAIRPVVTGGASVGLSLSVTFDLEAYRRMAVAAKDRMYAGV